MVDQEILVWLDHLELRDKLVWKVHKENKERMEKLFKLKDLVEHPEFPEKKVKKVFPDVLENPVEPNPVPKDHPEMKADQEDPARKDQEDLPDHPDRKVPKETVFTVLHQEPLQVIKYTNFNLSTFSMLLAIYLFK